MVKPMAQNHRVYAIIGNNGYGMSPDWEETISYAKFLQNEWHKGFQTEEEAYDWLVDQCSMRSRLNAYGMCDLATLRSQRLVTIDNNMPKSVRETFCPKPSSVEEVNSLEELDASISELTSQKSGKKKARKKALVKQFEKWLDSYLDE